MRIRIEFEASRNEVTLDYRYACMSYIKHLLYERYSGKYDELYAEAKMKSLTFGVYFPQGKIGGGKVAMSGNKLYLLVSSCDDSLILMLYNCAIAEKGKGYPFPDGLSVRTVNVKICQTASITSDKVVIKLLTPLLVRKHSEGSNIDEYLCPNDEAFSEYLNITVNNLMKNMGLSGGEVKLEPIEFKTTAVILKGKYYKGSFGRFVLSGDVGILNALYGSGIGSRRSQGFGMFDVEG